MFVSIKGILFFVIWIFLSAGFSDRLVESETLQERERERERELFVPALTHAAHIKHLWNLPFSLLYTPTGLQAHFLACCTLFHTAFCLFIQQAHFVFLFVLSQKPRYASCLNALSFSSEGCVVRAELKAEWTVPRARAYSSIAQQPPLCFVTDLLMAQISGVYLL